MTGNVITLGILQVYQFQFIKYEKMSKEDEMKEDEMKVEEVVIDMMIFFKYTPIKLGKSFHEELFNKIDNKLKHSLINKRQIRESTLAQIMPEFNKGYISLALREYTNKFVAKSRACLVKKNKIKNIVEARQIMWKKI